MKSKVLKSFLFALLLNTYLFPQWSNDPNNNLIIGYGSDPHICSDSAGGCYITYNASEPRELFLRRLDKYGYQPWGYKKQILGELPQQWMAEIIEDGEGGVIVSYEDFESNFPFAPIQRIRVQKVDSSGNFLWGQTGVKVSIVDTSQAVQRVVSDEDGGCVIVWMVNDDEYNINRINKFGQRVWGDSGIVLGSSAYNSHPRIIRATDGNYYVQTGEYIYRIKDNGEIVRRDSVTLGYIVPAPDGGMILSGRVWTGMIPKLVAQRKDSLGNNLWQEPYVEIADSLGLGSFRMGVNKSIINYSWLGTYNGQTDRPFFQAINLSGNILYQNKILLSEDSCGTTIIGIIASHNYNTIFSWSIATETDAIFAQMYNTLGNKLWNENGIMVAHPRMIYQQYTTDGRGGFIIAGLINNFTVAVQQVSINGYLGEILSNISPEEMKSRDIRLTINQNFPNPFNSTCTIQYSVSSNSNISIELYNTLGEKVKTIVNEYHNRGFYTVTLSSDDLSSGIYLYKMQTENKSVTKKLIIIK